MLVPINPDFTSSVSMSNFAMQPLYLLELTSERLTALMKLPSGSHLPITSIQDHLHKCAKVATAANNKSPLKGIEAIAFTPWQGIELLILEGSCVVNDKAMPQGGYLRLPTTTDCKITADTDCIIFVKYNQFLNNDTGERSIETRVANKWLPGPVEGIEIRPLHVFDTESIMLLRWQHAAEFKPNLNPQGEEILVVNGLLQTSDQLYRQFSWVRNPIEDWRKWHGNTGTIAYYKSGHFPADPARYAQRVIKAHDEGR